MHAEIQIQDECIRQRTEQKEYQICSLKHKQMYALCKSVSSGFSYLKFVKKKTNVWEQLQIQIYLSFKKFKNKEVLDRSTTK